MSESEVHNETKPVTCVKVSDLDSKFKHEISAVSDFERLRLCFQCGTCSADCPIARFSATYHPRKLIRMAQLGMKDRLLSSEALWLCTACFTCVDHCPQGVDIAGILRALRNMAVKEGVTPSVFRELTDSIMKTGYAYRITELCQKKRVERGLPPLPMSKMDDIARLFDVLAVCKVTKKEK